MQACLNLISQLDARQEQIAALTEQSRQQTAELRALYEKMSFADLEKLIAACPDSSVYQALLEERRERELAPY